MPPRDQQQTLTVFGHVAHRFTGSPSITRVPTGTSMVTSLPRLPVQSRGSRHSDHVQRVNDFSKAAPISVFRFSSASSRRRRRRRHHRRPPPFDMIFRGRAQPLPPRLQTTRIDASINKLHLFSVNGLP